MSIVLVPKEPVSREAVSEWMIRSELVPHPTQEDEHLYWKLWMTPDEKTAVHYYEDLIIDVSSFSIGGKRKLTYVKRLKKSFPIWERDDLLKHALFTLADGTPEQIAHVAMLVAVDMEDYDAASAGVLNTFLHMDERSTRLAGARAMRIRPFPFFHLTAVELAKDEDEEIARVGQGLLNRIIELHG